MYLNLFRISLYVLQVKIIFRLKFFNFPCPWLILDFLRLLALIIYQPYKTCTENNSYSIFWTHLIFNFIEWFRPNFTVLFFCSYLIGFKPTCTCSC